MLRPESGDLYTRFYVEPEFTREGLFDLLAKRYPIREVLYPGCFVHLTPSLYFPHVVYVDRSQEAQEYFRDSTRLISFVRGLKSYRTSPYIRFLAMDYTEPLPLRQESFDLVIALYAPGIFPGVLPLLRAGGLVLSGMGSAGWQDLQEYGLVPDLLIRSGGGKYRGEAPTDRAISLALKQSSSGSAGGDMVWKDGKLVFRDRQTYVVFRKPGR